MAGKRRFCIKDFAQKRSPLHRRGYDYPGIAKKAGARARSLSRRDQVWSDELHASIAAGVILIASRVFL